MKFMRERRVIIFVVLFVVIAIAIRALVIGYHVASRWELEKTNRNNLRLVMLGIESYSSQYRQLPPHAVRDRLGRPIHSWRTMVTPFLAAKDQLYRWDEPWDGPFNKRLAQGLDIQIAEPPVDESGRPLIKTLGPYDGPIDYAWPFRNVSVEKDRFRVHFFAVVGNETLWPDDRLLASKDIKDGIENTLMLVESHTIAAYWSEPKDLRFDEMDFSVNAPNRCGISGPEGYAPLVAFADGEVFRLNPAISPEVVRALLTANGGERVFRYQLIDEGWLH